MARSTDAKEFKDESETLAAVSSFANGLTSSGHYRPHVGSSMILQGCGELVASLLDDPSNETIIPVFEQLAAAMRDILAEYNTAAQSKRHH